MFFSCLINVIVVYLSYFKCSTNGKSVFFLRLYANNTCPALFNQPLGNVCSGSEF